VVTASANVEVAARRIAFGKLLNSGQTCVAPDHVLVDASVRDRLVDELASALTTFAEGRNLPLVSSRHAARIADLVHTAGGEVALGGTVDVGEAWAEPTIIVDPDPTAPIMSEEIFGPVLPVITVDSLDGAIAHVRAGTRPLAAYLFTEDRRDEQRMLAEVTSGATVVNQVVVHLTVPDLPFGGVGTSGMGVYHGHWGYETFSHPRAVVRRPSWPDLRFVYPPHSERAKALMRRLL
jgi:aldehyde dehydrogenase (NAD+)